MPCCYGDCFWDVTKRLMWWCKDEKVCYTDADGKDYCIFHAPQGKKQVTLKKFNGLIFERIKKAKEKKERCDLSGTILEGDIDFRHFNKDNHLPYIDFSSVQFSGNANFAEAVFSGNASFAEAVFSGNASFAEAVFSGEVFFDSAEFRGHADFAEAVFREYVDFWWVWFNEYADFSLCHISEKAKLDFRSFERAKTFRKGAGFSDLDIEGFIKFDGVDLSNVPFADTKLSKIDFVNVRWHKSGWGGWRDFLYDEIALFEKIKKGSVPEEERPKTLYTDYLDFKQWMKRTFLYAERYGDNIRKVEILYRGMKDKYRNLQNWPAVSNWHYGEKEMYRKENAFRRYCPFSISFLYWLSSGYGERYMKAGIVLAALIFIVSFGLGWTGLDAVPRYGANPGHFHGITSITLETLNLKSIGALLINTMKYATFQKDIFFIPRNMLGDIIRAVAQILIPLQTALFILAVRNRFRR